MPKFMSSHTVPAGGINRGQVSEMAKAAQNDPVVKPYRSFLNLSEGRGGLNTSFRAALLQSCTWCNFAGGTWY